MKSFVKLAVKVLGCLVVAPAIAVASTITFTNTGVAQNGSGYGNVNQLLVVSNNTSEYGSVYWNGSATATTVNATNQSLTYDSTFMAPYGSNFGLLFNIAEPGGAPDVTLFGFQLTFQKADGTSLFNVTYTAPSGGLNLTQTGAGVGSLGWLFNVSLTGSDITNFYGTGTNRIGMSISANNAITGSAGAAESFSIATAPSLAVQAVPEPTMPLLLGVGLLGLFLSRRRATR